MLSSFPQRIASYCVRLWLLYAAGNEGCRGQLGEESVGHGSLPSRARGTRHGTILDSPQFDDVVRNASGYHVEVTLKVLTPMLFHMRSGIYFAEDRGAFITSDNPCVWYDRDSAKRPPAYRGPALSIPNIQILLPLSPGSLLLLSHDRRYAGYRRADEQFIDEVNRLVRFHSHEHFVTHDGRARSVWFEERSLPADAWEYTEEGKAVIARAEKYKRMYERYEAARKAKGAAGGSAGVDVRHLQG